MLDQGVNLKNGKEKGFLHAAIFKDHLEVAELLLKKGMDINSTVRGQSTAVHVAVNYNRIKGIELLLSYGADPTIRALYDNTPLDSATYTGNIDCVKILVNRGSDVNAMGTILSLTPLDNAVLNDKFDSIECILSFGTVSETTKTRAFHKALAKGREDMAKGESSYRRWS